MSPMPNRYSRFKMKHDSTRAPSTHIGPDEWKREGLRLSQSVEIGSGRESRQKYPDHQPELSVQGESRREPDDGIAGDCRIEL